MKSHLKMALDSITAFSNDAKMDVFELKDIFETALQSGSVDEDEGRILKDIISRLNDDELTSEVKALVTKINKVL